MGTSKRTRKHSTSMYSTALEHLGYPDTREPLSALISVPGLLHRCSLTRRYEGTRLFCHWKVTRSAGLRRSKNEGDEGYTTHQLTGVNIFTPGLYICRLCYHNRDCRAQHAVGDSAESVYKPSTMIYKGGLVFKNV